MSAKRSRREADQPPPPPPGVKLPILPPLASVCGDALSCFGQPQAPSISHSLPAEDALLRPWLSWSHLFHSPHRAAEPPQHMQLRFHDQQPTLQPFVPAAARFSRALPSSPPREDSNSSADESPHAPQQEVLAADDASDLEGRKKPRVVVDRWLPEEDEQLTQAVRDWQSQRTDGLCPWRSLATKVGGNHTAAQCAQRWRRVLRPELKKGPWAVEQEERLIRLVLELGPMWAKVSNAMGDRSDIQCRYWFRKLRLMGAANWSPADDSALRQARSQLGNDWLAISRAVEVATKRRVHSPSACLARVMLVHPSMN